MSSVLCSQHPGREAGSMVRGREGQSGEATGDYIQRRAEETALAPRKPIGGTGYFRNVVMTKTMEELIAADPGSDRRASCK